MPFTARRSRLLTCLTSRAARLALGLGLAGWVLSAQAFFSLGMIPGVYIPQMYYKFGAVYTRAIVPGPNGRPVYVEYGVDGKEAREIGEATGQYERARVMPAGSYRSLLQRLRDSQERYPEQVVMKAEDYKGQSFQTAGGEAITKPTLAPDSLTAVVRPQTQRFLKDGSDLLLLELPIDTNNQPSASSTSLLLSDKGEILHQATNSIGFRVGFFGQDGKVADTTRRNVGKDTIYGALPDVAVTMGSHVTGGGALTDDKGKFHMNFFLPPCPGFTFDYTTPIYLELYYKRFNPRTKAFMPYYMTRPGYDFCNGLGVYSLAAMAIVATIATPVKMPDDFPIDLMVLDGGATLKGAELGEKTSYSGETSDYKKQLQEKYDFDGDEKPDWVVPGKKVKKIPEGETTEREVFVTTAVDQAELQGIYLSSRYDSLPADTEKTAPDFTRLIDTAPDFKDRGLLKSISKDDLRDTDIYVFRESNGQLVAERRGLHEKELYKNYSGVEEETGSFRYTIHLRGSVENYYTASYNNRGEAGFQKWQSEGGFKEEFQKRTANHLKAGETVRIIAINRPTGYMGSVRVPLQAATASGNLLNFASQQLVLSPPNLKIWAERKNKIEQGMTKGETRKQLIGNEGAGLGSDVSIAIYTDWRDQDGGPLPEELGDYGYTGRLAKIVAENQLAPSGVNNLSQFKIKPGQQVQVITLPEKVLAKQHLYLQVAGQPDNRNPEFSSGGGEGILQYRPTHFVPVQVPLHDEEASEIARQAYRKADKAQPELELKKPEPIYAWKYRPEMQFSLYELNVDEIRRKDFEDKVADIYKQKTPTFASSDKYVEVIYSLLKSAFGTLESWSYKGERDLVFAFGEEEIKVNIGASKNIRFENIAHLSHLDADDFLSLRLYTNNDTANVLFEFAFEFLAVDSTDPQEDNWNGEFYDLSADNPKLGMQAWLVGYEKRKDKVPTPKTTWRIEGEGALTQSGTVTGNEIGYFQNELTMPTVAGSKAQVTVQEPDSPTKTKFGTVRVIPGKPHRINLTASGQASIHESGTVTVSANITDKNGNAVADGTPVSWSVDGNASIKSSVLDTQGGRVTAEIVGGGMADTARIKLSIADINESIDTIVAPLDIQVTAPASVGLAQNFEVRVTVRNAQGAPVPNLFLMPISSIGRVDGKSATTNAGGEASFSVRSPSQPGSGRVGVNIGEYVSSTAVEAKAPVGKAYIANNILLVGDQPTAGTVQVDWVNNVKLDIPYKVADEVEIKGNPSERVTVELGGPGLPAIGPVLSFGMVYLLEGDLVPDSVGTSIGAAHNIQVVADGPIGVGKSFEFRKALIEDPQLPEEQGSLISVPITSTLALPTDAGFRIDIKPAESAGQVFALGQGQSLAFDEQGRLVFTVETDTGVGRVTTPPLEPNIWHNVVGRYRNGKLELVVNNAAGSQQLFKDSVDLQGNISYGQAEQQLRLGNGFSGRMRGFDLFDLRSSALLTFANGQTSSTITLDEDGKAKVVVMATGLLGQALGAEAKEALINRIPVLVHKEAESTESVVSYITLTTLDGYRMLTGMQVSTAPLPASADVARWDMPGYQPLYGLTLASWMPVAHAGWGDWVPTLAEMQKAAGEAVSIVAEAATYLVPYDDVITIAEQINYKLNDDPRYNGMLLAAASLSVLSVIPTPFTKPLKAIMKPIKAFAKVVGRGKFGVGFAKKFLAEIERCIDGRGKGAACKTLEATLPFIEVMAYMYLEDEQGFKEMVDSITSEETFLALFDFLLMGIEVEWFGLEGLDLSDAAAPYVPFMRKLNIANAYASEKSTRLLGRGLGKLRRELGGNFMGVVEAFRPLKPFLDSFSKVQRDTLLKVLVNKNTLKMVGQLVKRGLAAKFIHIVKGYNGQRLPQPVVWAMLYYLLVEKYDAQTASTQAGILRLIGIAFISMEAVEACKADGKNPAGRFNNANGALFHLSRIAGHLVANEAIKSVEFEQDVKIVRTVSGQQVVDGNFRRRSDIILESGKLIETKSYIGKVGTDVVGQNAFSPWGSQGSKPPRDDQKGDGSPPMKEFFLDQVLIKNLDEAKTRLMWSFDGFRNDKGCAKTGPNSKSGFDSLVIDKVTTKMEKAPGWLSAAHTKAMFDKQTLSAYGKALDKAVPLVLDVFGFSDLLDKGVLGNLTAQEIANIKAAAGVFP